MADTSDAAHLTLVVIGGQRIDRLPIPSTGRVSVGRTDDNDIPLDDASVSRTHAFIHLGSQLFIEDRGSANGTKLTNETIERGARVPFEAGQLIEVGSFKLLVQAATASDDRRPPATLSHLRFRLRRACELRLPCALLRVRVEGKLTATQVATVLTSAIAPSDDIAQHAPGEYLICIADGDARRAHAYTTLISDALSALGARAWTKYAVRTPMCSTVDGLVFATRVDADDPISADELVVTNPVMADLFRLIETLARGRLDALVVGEPGVGKTVVARTIHRFSDAASSPFRLWTADLGQEEIAGAGTVFVSDVGKLDADEQRALLALAAQQERPRIVATLTGRLEDLVRSSDAQSELLSALATWTLVVPPLRSRKDEIVAMFVAGAKRVRKRLGLVPDVRPTPRTKALLEAYAWHENVRELLNVAERAVLYAPGSEIEPEHLPIERLTSTWQAVVARPESGGTAEEEERRRILVALERCGGNQTRAAKELGISRRTLTSRLNKYKIPRPRKRVDAS